MGKKADVFMFEDPVPLSLIPLPVTLLARMVVVVGAIPLYCLSAMCPLSVMLGPKSHYHTLVPSRSSRDPSMRCYLGKYVST